MNVVLVGLNVYARDLYSLANRYLKVYAYKNSDIRSNVHISIKDFDYGIEETAFMSAIAMEKPVIVGFSALVWNMEKIVFLSRLLKALNKDIKIIVGGPQVSYKPIEILAKYPSLDYIVKGEGEVTFQELLLYFLGKGKSLPEIDGLAYRDNGVPRENRDRELIEDINQIPSPYLTENPEEIPGWIAQWETFRGCVYNCAYCIWGRRKLRFYDTERLKKELEYFICKGVGHILFVDSAINLNSRRLKEHFETILKNNPPIESIAAFLHLEDLEPSDIDFYCRIPFSVMEIGLQTTNPVALKNIGRIWKKAKFERNWFPLRDNLNRRFELRVDLIIGLPGDNLDTFRESLRYVVDVLKPDTPSLFMLQLLRGSRLHQQADNYGIMVEDDYRNWVKGSSSYSSQDMFRSKILGFAYYLMYYVELFSRKFYGLIIDSLKITKFQLIDSLAQWFEKNPHRLPGWFKDQFLAPKDLERAEADYLPQTQNCNGEDSHVSKPSTQISMIYKNIILDHQKESGLKTSETKGIGYLEWKKFDASRWIELMNDIVPDFIRGFVSSNDDEEKASQLINAFYGTQLIRFFEPEKE